MKYDLHTVVAEFISQDLLMREADAPIGEDEELLLSGLLDSIAVMRLVGKIETSFDIGVPPEDLTLENFASVAAIANYLVGRIGDAPTLIQ